MAAQVPVEPEDLSISEADWREVPGPGQRLGVETVGVRDSCEREPPVDFCRGVVIVRVTVGVAQLLARGQHHSECRLPLIGNRDCLRAGVLTPCHSLRHKLPHEGLEDLVKSVSPPGLARPGPPPDVVRLPTSLPVLGPAHL